MTASTPLRRRSRLGFSLVELLVVTLVIAILATLVLYVFLRRWSTTFVAVLCIPFSLIVTCGIVWSQGAVWFVDHSWNFAESQLVRVDPATKAFVKWQLPDDVQDAHWLTVGPAGRLYTVGFFSSSMAAFDPVKARYIRIEMVKRGTEYGNSLFEVMAQFQKGKWSQIAAPPPDTRDWQLLWEDDFSGSSLAAGSWSTVTGPDGTEREEYARTLVMPKGRLQTAIGLALDEPPGSIGRESEGRQIPDCHVHRHQ